MKRVKQRRRLNMSLKTILVGLILVSFAGLAFSELRTVFLLNCELIISKSEMGHYEAGGDWNAHLVIK